MTTSRILIVEDEALVAEDLKAHITEMGYQVSAIVSRGEDALALLEGSRPDLVMMDIVLAGEVDGIDVAQLIKEQYHIPVIFLTAYTDREKIERARAAEPYGYLVKPFDERELRTTISMALYKASADRRLHESRRWAHAVLASISDGVITTDSQGQVHYLNTQAERLTGWYKNAATGRPLQEVLDLVDPDTGARLKTDLSNLLEQGEITPGADYREAELHPREGQNIPIAFSLGKVEYEDGGHDGAVLAFRDITLQRQARQTLQQSNSELERRVAERTAALNKALQQAEQASEAKSRFLAIISHELRTPLNPAIGHADLLLLDDNLTDDQRESVEEILNSCKGLLGLINDMLELAHADTGSISVIKNPVDMASCLDHIVRDFQAKAAQKGLTLELILPQAPLPVVMADIDKIHEVLGRLLDNAIKFTDAGMILLEFGIEETADLQLTGCFGVTDTGIGIPKDKKDMIFDVFTQVDDSRTRRFEGTGLGLTLCKRQIDIMGGSIGMDDNPDGGSRFWFRLPLPRAQESGPG